MKASVALPPYLPDQTVNSGVLLRADNVYPAVDGYRPVKQFSSLSEALDEPFQGGGSFISSSDSAFLLSGTESDLYRLDSGAWNSLVTGLSITGRWRFSQFGDFVVAVNGSDTREVDLIAGTDSVLADAPSGNSIAVVRDFVVIGRADNDISMVKWSAFNDHTGWTAGVDQSGFQPMLSGGAIMGVAGGEYGIILQRFRIVRMTYTGDDFVFQFDEITPNVGCASAASIAQAGRSVFFLSDRGFMAMEDGSQVRPIGNEKVDRTFQAEVPRDDYERIHAAVDPQNTLVMWGIPGTPGKVWIYNWVLDRWATVIAPFSGIFPGFTASLSLEALSAIYPDLDAMPYSLDDPRFAGGEPRMYIVNNDGELGTWAGETMACRMDMGFAEYAKGRKARVRGVRPITDATNGVTVTMDARARLGDAENISTVATMRSSGLMPIRTSGRYIKTSLQYAEGTVWSYVQAFEVDYEMGGER